MKKLILVVDDNMNNEKTYKMLSDYGKVTSIGEFINNKIKGNN